MRTSPQHKVLSAEQLEAYVSGKISGKEKQQMDRMLQESELSREALEGYLLMPEATADLQELKNEIASRTANGKGFTRGMAGAVIVVVAVLSIAAYLILPEEKQQPALPAVTESLPVQKPDQEVLSSREDHFVNPAVKEIAVKEQKPAEVRTENGKENAAAPENAQLPSITAEQIPVTPVVPEHPEPSYNAQIGYVLDLKVTDFDKYYKTTVEVREPELTGVPAEFEDKNAERSVPAETVRMIPAEVFLREGLQAFIDGRYGRCISKMEVLLNENKDDVNAMFYSGLSYYKLEMHQKAILLFEKVLASANNVFHEEARWYLALTLDANGEKEAAQKLYQQIEAGKGFYSSKAKEKIR
ncbi:MAG: hypothetical protein Fur0041_06280 [Bacteroidia bacterium]